MSNSELNQLRQKYAFGGAVAKKFVSSIDNAIQTLRQQKGTGEQMLKQIQASGAKKEEMDLRRVPQFLANKPSVTKEQLARHLEKNPIPQINVIEKVSKFGGKTRQWQDPDGAWSNNHAKFGDATLQTPGGKNYREHLLQLQMPADENTMFRRQEVFDKYQPDIDEMYRAIDSRVANGGNAGPFEDRLDHLLTKRDLEAHDAASLPDDNEYVNGHWDEPQVVAHVRTTDRTGPEGEKILHVEEMQSDWHQQAREARKGQAKVLAREKGISVADALKEIPADAGYLTPKDDAALSKINKDIYRVGREGVNEEEIMNHFVPGRIIRSNLLDQDLVNNYHDKVLAFDPKGGRGLDISKWTVETAREFPHSGQRELRVLDEDGQWRGTFSGFRGTDADAVKQAAARSSPVSWSARVIEVDPKTGEPVPGALPRDISNRSNIDRTDPTLNTLRSYREQRDALSRKVPDAPFKSTWPDLAVKHVFDTAAREGYDKVSFAPASEHIKRYNMANYVDEITATLRPNGKFDIQGIKDKSPILNSKGISREDLAAHVGKDQAEKIVSQIDNRPKQDPSWDEIDPPMVSLTGENLKMGTKQAAGMVKFYDEMLPKLVDKYSSKEFGVGAGRTFIPELDTGKIDRPWHHPSNISWAESRRVGNALSVDIPQSTKDKILSQGQKLFSVAPAAPVGLGLSQEEPAKYAGGGLIKAIAKRHATAQSNAALPKDKGGLGLPADNTYIDRAGAMDAVDYLHGTQRLDRLLSGKNLDPKRATSGPMPFGTDTPPIASGYAMNKQDTSRMADDIGGLDQYFQVSPKSLGFRGKNPYTVEQSWNHLSPEVKTDILDKSRRIGYKNPEEAEGAWTLHPTSKGAPFSPSHFEYELKAAKGNPLAALRSVYGESGMLDAYAPSELADIYKLAGYPHEISQANAPWTSAQGVLTGKAMINNPLKTSNVEEIRSTVIPALKEAFKNDRTRLKLSNSDQWAKDARWTPKDWVNQLEQDLAKGDNSYVWTSIPDKVTDQIKKLGYQGIIDTGGKGGDLYGHQVVIPFQPSQVRSRWAAYDPFRRHEADILAGVGVGGVLAPELISEELNKLKKKYAKGGIAKKLAERAAKSIEAKVNRAKTEWEILHDTAQKNAALPKDKGGLGLPANNTYIDRANVMYPTDAYTGTNQDIRSLDPSKAKYAREGSGSWASENPEFANSYAGRPDGNVMPLRINTSKFGELDAANSNWHKIPSDEPIRHANGTDSTMSEYIQSVFDDFGNTNLASNIARKMGDKGLIVNNVKDYGGYVGGAGDVPEFATNFAIHDPSQVRSRFAAFDPMRRHEADILAGVGAGGVLAPELISEELNKLKKKYAEGGLAKNRAYRGEVRNTPQNKILGLAAHLLKPISEFAGKYTVPEWDPIFGGMTGADLTGVESLRKVVEDASYGVPPTTGTGMTRTLKPEVVDAAGGATLLGQVGKAFVKGAAKEAARQIHTGTGVLGSKVIDPRQRMFVGEKSQTWDSPSAAKAAEMESAGESPVKIWAATKPKNFKGADKKWRQEIDDSVAPYSANAVSLGSQAFKQKQYDEAVHASKLKEIMDTHGIGTADASKIFADKYGREPISGSVYLADRTRGHDLARNEAEALSSLQDKNFYGHTKEFYDNPRLYEAYPHLKNMLTHVEDIPHAGGVFSPSGGGSSAYITLDRRSGKTELLHEMQHAIQDKEGWARGSSPDAMFLSKGTIGPNTLNPEAQKIFDGMVKAGLKPSQDDAAREAYHRHAGEVESRLTESRMNMTPAERAANIPKYDVPVEDQIIKFKYAKGGKIASAGGDWLAKKLVQYQEQARPLSKAENIESGLYHLIGGGKKLVRPVSEMTSTKVPNTPMVPRKIISPEDLYGSYIVPALGDRTAAGSLLTHVGETKLDIPVQLLGGPDFMRSHALYDSAWAVDKGAATGLLKQIRGEAGGRDVYMPTVAMAHTPSGDFSTQMTDTLLGQIGNSKITKKAVKEFDRNVKAVRPEFKGLLHPETRDMLNANGALRHAFVHEVGLTPSFKAGFPDLPTARVALTEPELIDVPLHSSGFTIAKLDPAGRIVTDPASPVHPSYNTQLAGQYVGGFAALPPRSVMFPTFYNARRAAGLPESGDIRSFQTGHPGQVANQEWLDSVMNWMEKNPKVK